jgi:hypothetical protein
MVVRRLGSKNFRDGYEVVGLTRRPRFTPRKVPGTRFCKIMSRPQSHNAAGRITTYFARLNVFCLIIQVDLSK